MTCSHANFVGELNVGRISLTEGGPVETYVADVSVRCADCGCPFIVNWTETADPTSIPLSLELQKKRPWVSGLGQIMGYTLTPQTEEEPWQWGNVNQQGSA